MSRTTNSLQLYDLELVRVLFVILFRISIDKGVVGYTAKTGKLINVTDAKNCPYFSANVDELTGYTTNTLLCAPLTVQGRYVIRVYKHKYI